MTRELGHYNTSGTRTHVRFQFTTHASAGGNVAPSSAFEAADIRIYRANDGAAYSATQRSSANGITMTSPFDSLTGVHDVDVDLTDNTDAGFYAAGYRYSVVLAPDETVDSQTITGVVLAEFEIGPPPANVTQFGGTAGTFSSGRPEVNATHWGGTAVGSTEVRANLINIAGSAVSTSSAQIGVNVVNAGGTAWASGSLTSGVFATGAITATAIAADAIGASELATDAVQEIRNAITGGSYALDTDANGRIRIVDGTGAGELDTSSGTVTAGTVSDKTGYRLSATGVDDIWDEPLAAHTTGDTPGNVLNMLTQDTVTLSSDVALGSIVGQLLDAGTSWSYDRTTDSLEALQAEHDTTQSAISGLNNITAASVWAVGTRTLTSLSGLTVDTVTTLTNLPAITANWLTAAGLATDAVQEIRDAITGGAYALSTDSNGRVRIVDGTGAGEIDTTSGGVLVATLSTTAKGEVNAEADTALADAGVTTTVTGRIDAAVSTRATPAQVNAEVVDALATDTYAEPGQGAPAATTTLAAKLNYLFKWARNKRDNDGTQNRFYADDGSTIDQKQTTTSSGGTVTVGEMATGA